ncbi:D-alanine--D-alanine ligase family protein [Brachybacterium saurashtrense]|uniref:D-alanine--D-alanine ligase n=1 Tax=Brachybacterium saurashtrense TaxID=556288 RepID=A0A345YN30_9MICO|nr:D-alanine--D-alanine ligase family protein [Brachybacterium saurashtrense]AXK45332.1 D-alanine--D-alanine ligase [Brachybacterium saurashtrense]RRR21911.1 D-alanine--D-alanine ligase [Brachybacterium saurashtrense]
MRTTVALLFGGRSGEHGISCVTAGGILAAIDRERFEVVALGITREGRWVHVSADASDWTMVDGRTPEVDPGGDEVLLPEARHRPGERIMLRTVRDGRVQDLAEVDVVWPLLHGAYGEDGTVQGMLEMLDIPYVGSGVLASAAAMDKAATKLVLGTAGIDCAPGIVVHEDQWAAESHRVTTYLRDTHPLPWFVKPARAGSSLGVTRVSDQAQLDAAVKSAFAEDPKVLIEEGLDAREIECGVLQGRDGREPSTTLPGEVKVGADLDFYDYEAKYFGKGTVSIDVPAALPDAVLEEVRETALRAFRALGLEGLARVDMFVTRDHRVLVNEVNTMPGFTPYSMFPVLWESMGLSYADLIGELIETARGRRLGAR